MSHERSRQLPAGSDTTAAGITRRGALKRFGAAGVASTGFASFLAACGGIERPQPSADPKETAARVNHPKVEIGEWTFSNWPFYMDKALLKEYERRFGGSIKYLEDVNSYFEYLSKIQPQLERGASTKRDLIVTGSYITARMLRSDWLEPIDLDNVPNRENLRSDLKDTAYDAERQYSLPYLVGAVGLVYDVERVGGELTTLEAIFDPRFKGRVILPLDPYETACSVVLAEGRNPTDATIDDLLAAIDRLQKAADTGQFRRFAGDDFATDITNGNAWLTLAFSGTAIQLQSDNPNIRWAYPDEGSMIFVDDMIMPKKVEHPFAAETMMNFLYEPATAARLALETSYMSPVQGVREAATDIDAEAADNPLLFPPDEIAAKFHAYPTLSAADERTLLEAMAKLTGQ